MDIAVDLALPQFEGAEVVVPAPDRAPGNWSGAPSALLVDGVFWLAYRVRRPLDAGRGVRVVVARSTDGVQFDTVTEIDREQFGAASFERAALATTSDGPGGGWRLYLSCATHASKHWWIEMLEAGRPEDLAAGRRRVIWPGSRSVAEKDPVIVRGNEGWHAWICRHPLTEAGHEDRMRTAYLTSEDGLTWVDHGTVLAGTPGSWDARGARVTAVLSLDPLVLLYDGRASAKANWFETTGLAREQDGVLAGSTEPIRISPEGTGAFRYATAVPLPDGRTRFYVEAARADGSHDLLTSLG
ncbi:MAG TPA: hypothetical protein VFP34_16795 [Microlunatus sp.]|nr:hypothetical protein [Microlunatus sp.]